MPRKHIEAEYSNKNGWQFVTSKSGNLPKVLIIKGEGLYSKITENLRQAGALISFIKNYRTYKSRAGSGVRRHREAECAAGDDVVVGDEWSREFAAVEGGAFNVDVLSGVVVG